MNSVDTRWRSNNVDKVRTGGGLSSDSSSEESDSSSEESDSSSLFVPRRPPAGAQLFGGVADTVGIAVGSDTGVGVGGATELNENAVGAGPT